MGWEALEQWGADTARIEPLAGGSSNDVWSVRVNGQLAVARLGTRSDADLAWELERLRAAGIEQVVVVDLTRPELRIPVVKVVIPGLEGLITGGYVPGLRARARMKGPR